MKMRVKRGSDFHIMVGMNKGISMHYAVLVGAATWKVYANIAKQA